MSLTAMVEKARERVAAQKKVLPPEDLASRVSALIAEELAENAAFDIVDRNGDAVFTYPFYASVSRPGVVGIAEMVRGKSQEGAKSSISSNLDIAINCAAAGVAALSYVVEPSVFNGSDEEFFEIADTISVPVLHKDIIVEQYQVDLAFAQGAQAITLVARILTDEELKALSNRASELGMDAVVAVQNEEELAKALSAHARVVSINDILLSEAPLDVDGVMSLCEAVPEDVFVLVAGVNKIDDVAPLAEADVKGIILGDMLMKSDDRRQVVRAFDDAVDAVLRASMPNGGPMASGPGMPGPSDFEPGAPAPIPFEPGVPGPLAQPYEPQAPTGPDGVIDPQDPKPF